jgi:hypothetical protein
MTEQEVTYLVESSIWSVGGLLVGYVLGRSRRELNAVYRKVVQGHGDDQD